MKHIILLFCLFCSFQAISQDKVQIGVYYFDGWAGKRKTNEEWAKNAPTNLSHKLMKQFPEREPIWGWRDDDIQIMEKQIDLASENGIDFFIFCWYYSPDKGRFNEKETEQLPQNTALSLFLKAKNKHKMKFSIIVCNHQGFEIKNENNWIKTINYLSNKFFQDSQYLKIENKPVISFYGSKACLPYIKTLKNETVKNNYKDLIVISNHNLNSQFDARSWYNIRETEPGYQEKREYTQLTQNAEHIWNKYKNHSNIIPLVMSGWDQRPWEKKKEKTLYYINKTPQAFKDHLQNAITYVKNNDKCKFKMVFIYAWNEYGEGGWLAPTKGDKKGSFLEIIQEVKKNIEYYENSIY